jgi:hypothetical protein
MVGAIDDDLDDYNTTDTAGSQDRGSMNATGGLQPLAAMLITELS